MRRPHPGEPRRPTPQAIRIDEKAVAQKIEGSKPDDPHEIRSLKRAAGALDETKPTKPGR